MVDIKINASIVLQGGTLPAEPPQLKKGKKKRKKKEEKSEVLYRQEKIHMDKGKPIVISLREPKPARQVLHICQEAYNNMVASDNPVKGVKVFEWKKLSPNKRVKLHLQVLAESLGGRLEAFKILED